MKTIAGMFGRMIQGLKSAFGRKIEAKIESGDGESTDEQEEQKPKRKFWKSVCGYVFDDYVKELEDRADHALERHVRIRLRTAVYLLLIMIAAACISLVYLYLRKRYGL